MRQKLYWLWLAMVIIAMPACGKETRLSRILERGELVVVTRNAPTTYFEGREGLAGLEFDMVEAFAKQLGVKVRYITKDNLSEMLTLLDKGEVDLAAAGLTRTQERKNRYLSSPTYQSVTQQVVCRRGGKRPNGIKGLTGVKLVVPAETSYAELLDKLKQSYPDLGWQTNTKLNTEELLERVWQKQLDCTVADSNIVDINRRYYPELSVQFNLSRPQPLAWLMPPDATSLSQAVNKWMEKFIKSQDFEDLQEEYYGYIEVFDYVDIRTFQRRIKQRLPKYIDIFKQAASKYSFDWTYLAAISYQESHWNRRAKSPTGVRGIMMLTLTTAKEMGVKSRLDANQSIFGGARYLDEIRKRLPKSIKEPDRDWITLAAYNIGMGHIWDARKLAREMDLNPDNWGDFQQVLPLLAQKKYYKKLKHGYARGREPVIYVQRVRDYQDILINTIMDKKKVSATR
jgi:membrane-bound lytic murein transglycosylase F